MSDRRRAIAYAIIAVALALVWRASFTASQGFGPTDLERYEGQGYGVDLPDTYADRPSLLTWSRGDGQAYVTLAADPWAQGPARVMTPALYRYARVGYAWAGRLAGLGQIGLIPIGLLAVNIASVATLGWIAGAKRERWGLRSLLLVAIPGAMIATASDTAEAFGLALAAVGALASVRAGVIAGFVLGLVRPDFGTAVLLRRADIIPVGAAVAAAALGIRVLGTVGFGLEWAGSDGTIAVPLVGYVEAWSQQRSVPRLITVSLAAVSVITIWWGARREHSWRRLAFITSGIFVLMFAAKVLVEPVNALRAAAVLSLLWAIPDPSRLPPEVEGSETHGDPTGTL